VKGPRFKKQPEMILELYNQLKKTGANSGSRKPKFVVGSRF
jgi:hypothetical protein